MPMIKDEYIDQMHQLNLSHFIKCYELMHAYEEANIDNLRLELFKDASSSFLKSFPSASFSDFLKYADNCQND